MVGELVGESGGSIFVGTLNADRFIVDDTRTGFKTDERGGLTRGEGEVGRGMLSPLAFDAKKVGPVKLIVGPWKVIVVPEEGLETEGGAVVLVVVMTVGCFSTLEIVGCTEGLLNVTRVG